MPQSARSLSAFTLAMAATVEGFPLTRHNVFFSADSRAEFETLRQGAMPADPTIYVCAQDRDDAATTPGGPERLLILANAPPDGDARTITEAEVLQCTKRSLTKLEHCGLTLQPTGMATTTPAQFHRMFPATGGALYGPAVHGAMATFRRPGSRTKLPGLYLAGGATHPGAGVPMAALSGRLAASALMADLASTRPSRRAAMSGGMSTR